MKIIRTKSRAYVESAMCIHAETQSKELALKLCNFVMIHTQAELIYLPFSGVYNFTFFQLHTHTRKKLHARFLQLLQ